MNLIDTKTTAQDREIDSLIERGALFVINHSAGKDSQAMAAVLRARVPAEQLLVVHADLGRVEWGGNLEHIQATTGGLPIIVARNLNKDFIQMVEKRGAFPSPSIRQCTSDLKRDPIEREVRRYLKANPQFGGLVVNCMGIRAQESTARSRQNPFRFNKRNSKAGREWYDWLPIFEWTEEQVFARIAAEGQEPHQAYAAGMSRLSCVFCIMASKSDLQTAARLNPELYAEYVALEERVGHTMNMAGKTLEEVTGIKAQRTCCAA